MDKLLIIAFSDLENDPRVYRQIEYFSRDYDVTTIGWEPAKMENVRFLPICHIGRSRAQRMVRAIEYKFHRFEKLYWSIYDFEPLLAIMAGERFDLIITNDLDTLPFALKIANGAKVVLDTHEYAPGHFEDRFVWRVFFQEFNKYLCRTYMNRCDAIVTVSGGVAREYKKNYGIDPLVITNAVDYAELEPTPVDKDYIRVISHGVANPNRKLELMIEVMDDVDKRYHLDLMLLPTYPGYYRKLQGMAAKRTNVRIIPPVTRKEIIPCTNSYDLSFLFFKPTTINLKCGFFNKFFEFLQARLGIVSGPYPESHVEIVKAYDCGIVLKNFEPKDIASELNRLTVEQITQYKRNAGKAAREFTADKEIEKMGRLIKEVLGHR